MLGNYWTYTRLKLWFEKSAMRRYHNGFGVCSRVGKEGRKKKSHRVRMFAMVVLLLNEKESFQ